MRGPRAQRIRRWSATQRNARHRTEQRAAPHVDASRRRASPCVTERVGSVHTACGMHDAAKSKQRAAETQTRLISIRRMPQRAALCGTLCERYTDAHHGGTRVPHNWECMGDADANYPPRFKKCRSNSPKHAISSDFFPGRGLALPLPRPISKSLISRRRNRKTAATAPGGLQESL